MSHAGRMTLVWGGVFAGLMMWSLLTVNGWALLLAAMSVVPLTLNLAKWEGV